MLFECISPRTNGLEACAMTSNFQAAISEFTVVAVQFGAAHCIVRIACNIWHTISLEFTCPAKNLLPDWSFFLLELILKQVLGLQTF
ncbi:hypothetical protein KFK09_015845 [Dendrobium nobile]|uniref:Uncharacterized protein n=1 Tax=Dendrobium nobile TaxID=94219 RepID=A0A8T3B761_DENNO|nr:hypothetical protein KFK09_015845 [Dendrobium nobile]